jgi:hypothetical protein
MAAGQIRICPFPARPFRARPFPARPFRARPFPARPFRLRPFIPLQLLRQAAIATAN